MGEATSGLRPASASPHVIYDVADPSTAMSLCTFPYVTMNIAMVALAGYLLMSVHTFLAARVMGELRLSYLAMGPTELRLFLILLTIAMMAIEPGGDRIWTIPALDALVGFIGAALICLFIVQTLLVARTLARVDSNADR
ncbi:hypothetical protein GCM10020258_60450 [Sphingomonas yabuuchiae]